jgi:excisionase family DNA binding protein
MVNNKTLYSPTELAKLLGVSRQEVVRRIWRGFIKAEMVGKSYVITKAEVNKAIKSQKAKG